MHLHSILKSALLLLSGTALYAAPVITMDVTFPSDNTEIPHAICATRDNGYLVGATSIDSTGIKRALLIKVDASGNKNGTLQFPGIHDNEITGVVQSFDGGYVACGYTSPGSHGGEDAVIVKVDSAGSRIWTMETGNSGNDCPLSIVQTADSGFVIAGYSSGSSYDTTATLLKLNKDGVIDWHEIYTNDISIFRSVQQTSDGGFILTGNVKGTNAPHGGKDAFLFKVDSLGKRLWYKAYGGSGDETGYSVDLTLDGGYIVAGSTTSYGNGLEDAFVLKTDSVGHSEWSKTFGGADADEALGVICKDDSSYIVAGNMRSFSADSAAMLYQLDSSGDSVWSVRLQGVISQAGTPLRKSEADLFTFCYSHVNNGDTSIGIVAESNTIRDIDGNIYTTVQIGKQLWTVENIRTTRYNDGTPIAHITDNYQWSVTTGGAYCFYDNSTDPAYRQKWGALYNWFAVGTKKLAPKGWRVPTNADWATLENYLIANGYNWDGTTTGNKIGKSMASKTDWSSYPYGGAIGNDLSKNNASGFSALPGGCRNYDGTFYSQSRNGFWWSATEIAASFAYFRYLIYLNERLIRFNYDKGWGFSVRLLRD